MPKDIYILGLSQSHNATAALLKNGEIIGCISEERLNRKKNYIGYPKLSVDYLLKEYNIKPSQLSYVVLNFKSAIHYAIEQHEKNINTLYTRLMYLTYKIKIMDILYEKLYGIYKETINAYWYKKQIESIATELSINKEKIISYDHYLTHAASVVYGLGLQDKKILVLTNDGAGDTICASVNIYEDFSFRQLSAVSNDYSLAGMYGAITAHLGMKVNEHEYKVMGLAPYTNPHQSGVDTTLKILKDQFTVQGLKIISRISAKHYPLFLDERLKRKRFDWIAYSAQKMVEDHLACWVSNAVKQTGIHIVACAGGIFMNVKANKTIGELPEVKKLYVMPSSADESTAIGAAYLGYIDYSKKKNRPINIKPLSHLYLGNAISNNEVMEYIKINELEKKYEIRYEKDPEKAVAKLLADGHIVARVSGKMEFGQRALGNRSILANPSMKHVVQEINDRIKSRDFWMPFAGSILEEEQNTYIHNPKKFDASFMILSFDSTKKAQETISAALHPYDFTIRPQVVSKKTNPKYHYLISSFKKLTGIGALLNTSFNLHGEPVVGSIKDAVYTLEDSGLEYLQLENYIVKKIPHET